MSRIRPISMSILTSALLLIMLSTGHARAMSQPYIEGFNMALAHGQNNCSFGGANSQNQDLCVQGYLAGQAKVASLTSQYHVGYVQGVKDHLDGVVQNFCSMFPSNTSYFIFSAQWDCQQGYQAGWAAPVTGVSTIDKIKAYKVGYLAGTTNSSLGYQACAKFTGREGQICTNAFDKGYNTLPWSKTDVYNLGYKYDYTAAREKNPSPDSAGDCSFAVVNVNKSEICEKGWDAGWKAGGGK